MNPIQRALKRLLKVLIAVITYSPVYILVSRIVTFVAPGDPHSSRNDLHFALVGAESPLYGGAYPVHLTAGVVPKRFHSHNDCRFYLVSARSSVIHRPSDVQSVPLLKALSYGAGSIEADIWLVDGELYVRENVVTSPMPNLTFDSGGP